MRRFVPTRLRVLLTGPRILRRNLTRGRGVGLRLLTRPAIDSVRETREELI